MDFIALFLLALGLISAYMAYKLHLLIKRKESSDELMSQEAERVLLNNAENTFEPGCYPLQNRVHCTGLSVIKDSNGKYTLIPQIKVCDIGLY